MNASRETGDIGILAEGSFNGPGIFHDEDGTEYIGEFAGGHYHGKGILTFPEGHDYRRYLGEFEHGEFWGEGTLYWSDDRCFLGWFCYDRCQEGILTWPDDRKLTLQVPSWSTSTDYLCGEYTDEDVRYVDVGKAINYVASSMPPRVTGLTDFLDSRPGKELYETQRYEAAAIKGHPQAAFTMWRRTKDPKWFDLALKTGSPDAFLKYIQKLTNEERSHERTRRLVYFGSILWSFGRAFAAYRDDLVETAFDFLETVDVHAPSEEIVAQVRRIYLPRSELADLKRAVAAWEPGREFDPRYL